MPTARYPVKDWGREKAECCGLREQVVLTQSLAHLYFLFSLLSSLNLVPWAPLLTASIHSFILLSLTEVKFI